MSKPESDERRWHNLFRFGSHSVKVPVENLIGEEGNGLDYILTSMNSERVLIASECIGDGKQSACVLPQCTYAPFAAVQK